MKNYLNGGLGARIIGVSVPIRDTKQSLEFYSHLLGHKMGRSLSDSWVTYYLWGSAGVKLTFMDMSQMKQPDWETQTIMINYRVNNLHEAEKAIISMGGKKLHGPFPISVSDKVLEDFKSSYEKLMFGDAGDVTKEMGTSMICMDPSGHRFILTELKAYAEKFHENGQVSRHEMVEHVYGLSNAQKM